jgi:hypothetical protein
VRLSKDSEIGLPDYYPEEADLSFRHASLIRDTRL